MSRPSLAGWHSSSLACLQPAPASPRKFPPSQSLTSPRDEEKEQQFARGSGKAVVGPLLGKASPGLTFKFTDRKYHGGKAQGESNMPNWKQNGKKGEKEEEGGG